MYEETFIDVHMPTESWYSEQLLESAVGIVLKRESLALAVGRHGDPRQRKDWYREKEYQVQKCRS